MNPILMREALRWLLSAPERPDYVVEFCERFLRVTALSEEEMRAVRERFLLSYAAGVLMPLLERGLRSPAACAGCAEDQAILLKGGALPALDPAKHTCQ